MTVTSSGVIFDLIDQADIAGVFGGEQQASSPEPCGTSSDSTFSRGDLDGLAAEQLVQFLRASARQGPAQRALSGCHLSQDHISMGAVKKPASQVGGKSGYAQPAACAENSHDPTMVLVRMSVSISSDFLGWCAPIGHGCAPEVRRDGWVLSDNRRLLPQNPRPCHPAGSWL